MVMARVGQEWDMAVMHTRSERFCNDSRDMTDIWQKDMLTNR